MKATVIIFFSGGLTYVAGCVAVFLHQHIFLQAVWPWGYRLRIIRKRPLGCFA